MNHNEEKIYQTIFDNAILFIKRAFKEILSDKNHFQTFDLETGIISSLFVQMSIELGLKAFLIKNLGIRTILINRYANKTDAEILDDFQKNDLHTKKYFELKNIIIDNEQLLWFGEKHLSHLDQFQEFRNKLVHLNLFLAESDLFDLKGEMIYTIVHILLPLLSEIGFDNESPTEFYSNFLSKEDYLKLINFPPYVEEMERVALEFTGAAYFCPECYKKTYSTENNLCYCCNLRYPEHAIEYVDCIFCDAENTVLFDPLNIADNNSVLQGLCLNCENKPMVFKCSVCDSKASFICDIKELKKCKPNRCANEI